MANSKYSLLAVFKVAAAVIEPFVPQEPVPAGAIVLSFALKIGLSPAPADAVAVTFAVVAAGAVVLIPVGKFQRARVNPHKPVPGVSVLTVSDAAALSPVSTVPMKRLFVVLLNVPVAVGVTLTFTTQLPFAATVPFEKVIELAPAFAV